MLTSKIKILAVLILVFAVQLRDAPAAGGTEPQTGLLPGYSPAGVSGDVDGDGRRDIFDLLSLLKLIAGNQPYLPSADLDNDSEVDLDDLLILLDLLAPWHDRQEDFEFAILFEGQFLGDKCMMTLMTDQGCHPGSMVIPEKRPYRIYSNKQLVEISFVFGDDTLSAREGLTGPDFEPVPLDTAYIGEDSEINVVVPWRIHLEAADGSTVDSAGSTEVQILVCVIIDGSVPILGREIEFPVVLEGYPQRFIFLGCYQSEDSVIAELNPEQADCVIFPDIDSLASAIRNGLRENIEHLYISPAVDRKSGKKTDRLIFELGYWGGIGVGPLDGNEELMSKLGFPSWLPREYGYYDLGYSVIRE